MKLHDACRAGQNSQGIKIAYPYTNRPAFPLDAAGIPAEVIAREAFFCGFAKQNELESKPSGWRFLDCE